MTLLKDNENSIQIAMRSIDNDTELVESIANQFESAGSTKTLPYNFYTLHEQTDRRRDYITGKLGIAPFALNVTNQALTMAYGVKLKESEFTKLHSNVQTCVMIRMVMLLCLGCLHLLMLTVIS